jgi:hypothetical protein
MTALGVIFIYISSILPTSRVFLLAAAAFIIPLSIVLTDVKYSLMVYASTSILAFLLIGIRWNVMVYIVFFGAFGFIKYYIEKIRKLILEYVLKLIYFNITLVIIFLVFHVLFTTWTNINISFYLAILMLQVIFLFYDYFLSVFISYINTRFKNII